VKKPHRFLSLVYPQGGWRLSNTREVGLGKTKEEEGSALPEQDRLLHFNSSQGVPRKPGVSGVCEA